MTKQTPKSTQTLEGYLLYSSQGDCNATFLRSSPLWALTMAILTIGGCNPPMSRSGSHRAARERRTSDVVQWLADGADPDATDLHETSAWLRDDHHVQPSSEKDAAWQKRLPSSKLPHN